KAIALAVQRAHEARRPTPFPQRLAQGLHTGFQRLVADKLVRPQVLEKFLLGDHTIAMCQEVREYLKDFAPELHQFPSVMQLIALRVQNIVTKGIAHRLSSFPTLEHLSPQDTRGFRALSPKAI